MQRHYRSSSRVLGASSSLRESSRRLATFGGSPVIIDFTTWNSTTGIGRSVLEYTTLSASTRMRAMRGSCGPPSRLPSPSSPSHAFQSGWYRESSFFSGGTSLSRFLSSAFMRAPSLRQMARERSARIAHVRCRDLVVRQPEELGHLSERRVPTLVVPMLDDRSPHLEKRCNR